MAHTPKMLQCLHIYFKKLNKPPDGFCTHIFFDLAIILIFGGVSLYRLSSIIKVNLKWLRVPTTDFERQKCRTKSENSNSSKLIWKARKKPTKGHTNETGNCPIIQKNQKCFILILIFGSFHSAILINYKKYWRGKQYKLLVFAFVCRNLS